MNIIYLKFNDWYKLIQVGPKTIQKGFLTYTEIPCPNLIHNSTFTQEDGDEIIKTYEFYYSGLKKENIPVFEVR